MAIKKISKRTMTVNEVCFNKEVLTLIDELESKGELIKINRLDEKASLCDHIKWDICREIIIFKYLMDFSSQKIADLMNINKSRVSEILHYKVERFTIDRLLNYLEAVRGINPKTDQKLKQIVETFSDQLIAS